MTDGDSSFVTGGVCRVAGVAETEAEPGWCEALRATIHKLYLGALGALRAPVRMDTRVVQFGWFVVQSGLVGFNTGYYRA